MTLFLIGAVVGLVVGSLLGMELGAWLLAGDDATDNKSPTP